MTKREWHRMLKLFRKNRQDFRNKQLVRYANWNIDPLKVLLKLEERGML